MRIWLFSDLHLEGCDWRPPVRPDFDVLVAAGDIHDPAFLAVEWLADVSGGKPVIYVPGNHEWYAHRAPMTVEQGVEALYAEARGTNVHVLMDEAVVLQDGDGRGVRFLGSTLWTDFAIGEGRGGMNAEGAMAYAAVGMNDHRVIYTGSLGNRMSPAESREWHRTSRAWLEAELAKGSPEGEGAWHATVVVTHHLPHPRSVSERFRGSPLTPAFASDLSELVEDGGAALWIHGHTHDSFDYQAGGTRVVCNPKGYGPNARRASHENGAFEPALVVDVRERFA